MLKNILNLDGAQELSKNDQKSVQGAGWPIGLGEGRCPSNPNLCQYPSGFCGPCHL